MSQLAERLKSHSVELVRQFYQGDIKEISHRVRDNLRVIDQLKERISELRGENRNFQRQIKVAERELAELELQVRGDETMSAEVDRSDPRGLT